MPPFPIEVINVFATNRTDRVGPKLSTDVQETPSSCLALIVVDGEAQTKFTFFNGDAGEELKKVLFDEAEAGLKPALQDNVRGLIRDLRAADFESSFVLRDGQYLIRLTRLVGVEGVLFGLFAETDSSNDAIRRAASRYHLTRRQVEVLVLVLGGASASDVARSLVISEYTAQGYVKSLLAKTESRNRSAMISKILNWREPRNLR